MNKKNLNLILIGVFLILVRFLITIGDIRVDISNDIVGFALILLGSRDFKKLNSLSKKSFLVAIFGFVGAVVSQVLNCMTWAATIKDTMYSISIGISVIFAIYYTYYFIEALMMEAKVQGRQAATRNYQIMWFVVAALIFAHYFIFMSTISTQSTVVEALIVIVSMYSCLAIKNTAKQLC